MSELATSVLDGTPWATLEQLSRPEVEERLSRLSIQRYYIQHEYHFLTGRLHPALGLPPGRVIPNKDEEDNEKKRKREDAEKEENEKKKDKGTEQKRVN